MKKILSPLGALLLFACIASAQYPTNMNGYIVAGSSSVGFQDQSCVVILGITFSCSSDSRAYTEIPPWTIAGGWHTYLMSNGSQTNTYSTPADMISNSSINVHNLGPYFAVGPDASKPWKRNYSEIYSAHYFAHPTQGNIDIGFCHDENKNQCGEQNTINPNVPVNCAVQGNDYHAYYAMVSAVWTTSTQANNWGQQGYTNDIGPILWPSVGFVAPNDSTASQGLLQPSSIISGGYIYIYIWDKGPNTQFVPAQEGRTRGIKLVRVSTANCLDPTQYEVYYKGPSGVVSWLPSLPAGFTKENMLQYVTKPGPMSTDILPDEIPSNTEAFRFTAAQVNNTNYFIGCEEYVDNNDLVNGKARHHVALRFSNDLINWSPREMIIETSDNWDASYMNYPIFLGADGWSNTAIDLNNFYVLGTHSQSPFFNPVNKLNIQLYTPPPPPPPPPVNPCNPARIATGSTTGAKIPCPEAVRSTATATALPPGFIAFYPNPAEGLVTIQFSHDAPGAVTIGIYDELGRQMSNMALGYQPAGPITKTIDMTSFHTGIYFVKLAGDGLQHTGKIFKK